ncbi:MAG: deoxyribose-phosphate aldolase [Actinobacteria bacterium]|nr:deoxyribose-phosphate aldolase [Acidimicrobiia bacterium]NDE21256.1 deoxyribose-phosphate aldolase [Actinomycetota bacterium]
MTPRTAGELARFIDHTLLAPEATRDEVLATCRDAAAWQVAAVCLSPSWLPLPVGVLGEGVRVCTVVGFPSGAHTSTMKAAEAAEAVRNGADEIDMVVNLGLVRAGDWRGVEADIHAARQAIDAVAGRRVLKVICESAALSDDELRDTCRAAVACGADFVKTSTGFHKAGGATERSVAIMRETVGDNIGVKASGGIRTTAAALAMIVAGASRIGASATREILAGMPA